jgi:hypothetical protein
MEKRFDFPGIWIYNIIMLKIKDREVGEFSKIDNKMIVNIFEEWNCRGDRGIESLEEEIDLNKIVKFYENCDEFGDCERGIDLNRWEELIVMGGGFIDGEGVEMCLERVEKLIDKESVCIVGEENVVVIGNKSSHLVEIDFCDFKIDLLRGEFGW